MSKDTGIHEVLPKLGFLFEEDSPATIVSKPKLMPLKTVTLEKLEKMQLQAEQKMRQEINEEYSQFSSDN